MHGENTSNAGRKFLKQLGYSLAATTLPIYLITASLIRNIEMHSPVNTSKMKDILNP